MELKEEEPKQTLYINNLNEKIAINELRQILNLLFSKYGPIINIIAKKNILMRGQAFVIFEKKEDAENAKKELHCKILFKKKMRVNYAKEEAYLISNKTDVKREKKILKDYFNSDLYRQKLKEKKNFNLFNKENEIEKEKEKEREDKKDINNILFIRNIPNYIIFENLVDIFGKYPGFLEVRFIRERNCAFVEFDDDTQAQLVLINLKDYTFQKNEKIEISFSKK
jgi:U2 small nuclear ribonucleoprotein B''